MNGRVLFRSIDRPDLKVKILPLHPGFEELEFLAQFPLEMIEDFAFDIDFGGRGKAGHCGEGLMPVSRKFPNEACHVEIVGSKIVPPFGKAVGLVDHPRTDLAKADDFPKGAVAELLGGHVEDGHIAQADAFEHLVAFRGGQQAVDGRGIRGAGEFGQVVDLILHQGLKGGNDDGEKAEAVVARKGGELIAKGFTTARREDRQMGAILHAGADYGLLQAAANFRCRRGTERRKTEIALELARRVRILTTIRAAVVITRAGPQQVEQTFYLGEASGDPWREHGIGACHEEPSQHVGKSRAGGRVVERGEQVVGEGAPTDQGG